MRENKLKLLKELLESFKSEREVYEPFVMSFEDETDDALEWAIEQVELMQHFAKKNAELNVFLSKYSEPKHLGKNVIDVAMDIIAKQAERVQELEEENKFRTEQMESLVKNHNRLDTENKRYRKLLEFTKSELDKALMLDVGLTEKQIYMKRLREDISKALEEPK
ncbi:MAG TPA: hypothetical protein VK085_11500 [Pseudogracilibacillus sp.]|nr:hypothetical protein [Pseudogracilibacillus sp.]